MATVYGWVIKHPLIPKITIILNNRCIPSNIQSVLNMLVNETANSGAVLCVHLSKSCQQKIYRAGGWREKRGKRKGSRRETLRERGRWEVEKRGSTGSLSLSLLGYIRPDFPAISRTLLWKMRAEISSNTECSAWLISTDPKYQPVPVIKDSESSLFCCFLVTNERFNDGQGQTLVLFYCNITKTWAVD